MERIVLISVLSSAGAFAPARTLSSPSTMTTTALGETKADLEAIAEKANPVLKYFDPLKIGDADETTIGWFRHSEIKHGRIAMAAFVGYVVQSNFIFPWPQTMDGALPPSVDLTPEAQWDAIPFAAKAQIISFIAFLEFFDESGGGGALPHYTKGRKPGQYPSLKDNFPLHPVLDLYDPFGFHEDDSPERKEEALISELNNGRLAQLAILAFIAANKYPGSVPLLDELGAAPGYSGNALAPFEGHFTWFY